MSVVSKDLVSLHLKMLSTNHARAILENKRPAGLLSENGRFLENISEQYAIKGAQSLSSLGPR